MILSKGYRTVRDNEILKSIRKDILESSYRGKDGNLQSCFSSVEIIWALYDRILHLSPETVLKSTHNRFILSKGQSNLALMTVLAHKGFLPIDELQSFCQLKSRIAMQADRTKFNGFVENSAGSLGHGFPIAVGMAWAAKIKQSSEQVFVLAGDGEMNEGSMWEAMIFAASEKLDNLTLIIDDNDSISKMINMGNMKEKLNAFGFNVEVVNGHSVNELCTAIEKKGSGSPKAVIAKTKRGYGSNTLMEDPSWFHRWPNKEELKELQAEVDEF